jgi:hypothetical protein
MSIDLATRLQEGALSALKTPAPPAPAKVVPIAQVPTVSRDAATGGNKS